MKHLHIDRLHTQFAAGTTHTFPLIGRMYTLTHSDATGDLYLTIGRAFATEQLNAMRDEVLGEWKQAGAHPALFIYVFVGSKQMGNEENIRKKAGIRKGIALGARSHSLRRSALFPPFPFLRFQPYFCSFHFRIPGAEPNTSIRNPLYVSLSLPSDTHCARFMEDPFGRQVMRQPTTVHGEKMARHGIFLKINPL
ncbi:staygreen family protein [Geobacillus proteiniphilus]|uniref:staygreen family protein n=1 Tax=Geobacillus proteiniphilus TaxID=860353 RepID=UPI003FCDD0C8